MTRRITTPVKEEICEFAFEDSFDNTGTGKMVFDGNNISLSFNVSEYAGSWCVAAAAGNFVKTDSGKRTPEDEWF